MSITELTVPLYEAAWLPWAVQYFFFIGLSTTATLLAAVADLGGGARWRRLQPAALLVALSAGIVAPVALLADLHQPGRFWHFYAHFTPWSWMSIGSLLLPVYFAALVGYVVLWQRERLRSIGAPAWLGWLAAGRWSGRPLLPWLATAAALAALAVLIYTGSEIRILRSRALWNTFWMLPNLALTGLLAAVSAILFSQRWVTGAGRAEYRFSLTLLRAVLGLTVAAALGWGLSGWITDSRSFAEALRLLEGFGYWRLVFLGSVLIGALLLVGAALAGRRGWLAHAWLLAPVGLAAAWAFRWVVLMRVQTVPKYGAGLYPYELPLGSDGLLGVIATFGLWVAVFVLLSSFLDWGGAETGAADDREFAHV